MRIDNIASKALKDIVSRVNVLWGSLFTSRIKSSLNDNDYILIRDSEDEYDFKKVTLISASDYFESGGISEEETLVEWTQGKDYEPLSITRDGEGRVTSMTVQWPDGSSGTYTATDYNATHEVYDGFTITHVDSGSTITQSAVTRNADGAIIVKPALIVT